MSQEGKTTVYSSQVLDRVMQILDCFTNETPELSFSELAERLDLNRSTLYRLIEATRSHGLTEIDPETGKYHLGLRLFELGTLAVGRLELQRSAIPVLEKLVDQTGETAHLCVLDGSDVVYVAKVESRHTLRIPSSVGRRNPAYCTGVGKAILAFLPEEELAAFLKNTRLRPLTKKTIVSTAELEKQLKTTRMRGYSVDDQEIDEGIRCVGAPVRDHNGQVVAAVSIAGPSIRITKSKLPSLAARVQEAGARISEQLGYRVGKQKSASK